MSLESMDSVTSSWVPGCIRVRIGSRGDVRWSGAIRSNVQVVSGLFRPVVGTNHGVASES